MDELIDIQDSLLALEDVATRLARDVGISLSRFHFEDGRNIGCTDSHIISLTAKDKTVVTKVTHKEIAAFLENPELSFVATKLRCAFDRLHLMLMNS